MKKSRILKNHYEMNGAKKREKSKSVQAFIVLLLMSILGGCGGGNGDSTGQSTDTSDDSAVTAVLAANAVSSGGIGLSWTNPADRYSYPPQYVYSEIYRNDVKLDTVEGFSYTDTTLQPEARYCYTVYVTAVYWFISYTSTTWQSNSACATTLADTESPSTPVEVSAAGLSTSEIKLSWAISTDNSAVSGYNIYRNGSFLMTSATSSIVDTMLAARTAYCYTVSAYDATGNESAQSTATCAATMVPDYIIDGFADGSCYNNSMSIDRDDALHLAYISGSELRYTTNASGQWSTAAIGDSWGYPAIAAYASDKVHIATHGAYISNASGAWVTQPLPEYGTVPSIAIDGNGRAYISFTSETTTPLGYADRSVKYTTNRSGTWVTETVSKTYLTPVSSLALDSNSKVHVAFGDTYPGSGSYIRYANNASGVWQEWSIAGPLQEDGECEFGGLRPSVVVDPTDKVHIAVGNMYLSNVSGSWQAQTYDPAGSCPSIALDPSKNPHIVYKTFNAHIAAYTLKHATRGQAGWSSTALSKITQPSRFFSIAVDSTGGTHISYCNGGDIVYLKEP